MALFMILKNMHQYNNSIEVPLYGFRNEEVICMGERYRPFVL